MYPFLLHSLSMSVFSSVIGPFGGFFASGFKRAFKIKVSFNWKGSVVVLKLCLLLLFHTVYLKFCGSFLIQKLFVLCFEIFCKEIINLFIIN